jgi:serine/threonine-protein kinase
VSALSHRDEYAPVPEPPGIHDSATIALPGTRDSAAVGHVLLLAGRAREALPWLEAAAHACQPMVTESENSYTAWIVPAAYELGLAREAAGDRAGACAAYEQVLDRWGEAVPRSTTADAARRRMRDARCGDRALTTPR